jgi:hypothetical protein
MKRKTVTHMILWLFPLLCVGLYDGPCRLLHFLDVHAFRICDINEGALGYCEESAAKSTNVLHRTAEEYRIIHRICMYSTVYHLGAARLCSCFLRITQERLYNLLPYLVPLQLPTPLKLLISQPTPHPTPPTSTLTEEISVAPYK